MNAVTCRQAPRSLRRRSSAVALLLLAALAVLTAPGAQAHALVKSTFPADGAVLDVLPEEISLAFNEGVAAPTAALRVHNDRGERIDGGDAHVDPQDATRILVELPESQAATTGTIVVTWRAVSIDGHPVRGAWLFSVGAGTAGVDDDWVAQMFAASGDRAFAVAAVVLRGIGLTGILVLAGIALFGAFVPFDDPEHRLKRVSRVAAVAGLVASIASIPVQAVLETGLGIGALAPGPMGDVLAQPVGWAALLRAALLSALLWRLHRGTARGRVVTGLAVATVLSLALDGHSLTESPVAVMFIGDLVHVLAAAAWSGGLVALLVLVRSRRHADDPIGAAKLVAGFSRMATWSLVGLLVAGSAMSWVTVRALRAATTTSYGWTLLAKVAIVGVAILVGLYNNRRLVPAIEGAAADDATDLSRRAGEGGWLRLRQTLAVEAALMALAVAATALLVGQRPASQAAGVTGAYTTYVDLTDDLQVNVVVDPNRAGVNEIHLYLLHRTGRPATADQVTVILEQPENDLGPFERTPEVTGPGHWSLTGRELAVPGEWLITMVVRTGRFSEERVTVPVVVNR